MATFKELIDKAYVWFNAQAATGGATEAKQDAQETSLNAIQAAVEGTVDVEVSGYVKEYLWLDSDSEPTPGASDRVYGVEVATATGIGTAKYWNGTA